MFNDPSEFIYLLQKRETTVVLLITPPLPLPLTNHLTGEINTRVQLRCFVILFAEWVQETNTQLILKINFTDAKNDKYDNHCCDRRTNKCATEIPFNNTIFELFYESLPHDVYIFFLLEGYKHA